ncbi:hypothetical protein CkaCkLH20_01213 [Colletotrichum karsti]|uniref:Protein IMPACT-like protein n=1 Tax=Colletotrichum karsti TaxID=1095194 RepID=A0A9P6ICG9_9PEZI|nr:uncharacterized protein CkaCkLH20_01213 [Colletotrichum karsti]KAF9881063.1 hypothetical protein CkaCkLH20_01213 [Colletotrichum karsti]
MSDDLKDEIEVINSIYGDGTLTPAPPDYVLALPGASSLTLRLPESYPDVPPQVLGTHSAGDNAPRGAGARDLALFRDAVATAYQPGAVCLFDAIEEYQRWAEASAEAEAAARSPSPAAEAGSEGEVNEDTSSSAAPAVPDYLAEEPPWVISDPFVELKSVFVARAAPVTSPERAAAYVQHLLATDKKARTATHNMTAWRIRGPNGTSFQDCDDDGETAAGGRLLHLMQLMDLWDVMVVVTRWYGGQKLGPRRFALINSCARDAFVKAGWVEEAGKKKGGK